MDIKSIFKKKADYYKLDIAPVVHYLEIAGFVLGKMKPNLRKPKEAVRDHISLNRLFKNPIVNFRQRDIKGDISMGSSTLAEYIKYFKDEAMIMVPSFTMYFNPSVMKSLHSEFIDFNVKRRTYNKKLAFKYRVEKVFSKFIYHNILQKAMKIFNNSLSGSYASPGTVLHNPSAHYTLTSMTRVISGIGNGLSESIIAGNRHYRDPDIAFNHVATIAANTPAGELRDTIAKYNLYIPTPDDVLEAILHSTSRYWRDVTKEQKLHDFISNLTDEERTFVTYHLDFFHLRKHNDKLMRDMITEAITYEIIPASREDHMVVINELPDWLFNMAVHANYELLKGMKLSDASDDAIAHVSSSMVQIERTLLKYHDLIQTFLITSIFPTSIAYIKDMVRDAIVLSDTDSTCATYQDWVVWYRNGLIMDSKSLAVSAVVMTIVTQTIDHYIKDMATNLNISYEAAHALEMKNEFTWSIFVLAGGGALSKHYFSDITIQESDPLYFGEELKDRVKQLEIKGVNLIAPNAYKPVRELSKKMMIEIMTTAENNKKISIVEMVNQVVEMETFLYHKLRDGDTHVLKLEKIKEAKAYKKDSTVSPYMNYTMWQDVFASRYGDAPDPTYMAVKIPTTVTTPAALRRFLEEHEDREFADSMSKFLKYVNKDKITIFRLPLTIIHSRGIPREILPIVDFTSVIRDNCNVLYLTLRSLGYAVEQDKTIIDIKEIIHEENNSPDRV